MIETVAALMARHLPAYGIRSVTELGGGLENVAYEVNGELIVRRVKHVESAGEAVAREAELLAVVSGFSTLPVPEPVFVDAEAGVLAYTKIPGEPLNLHPVAEPQRLAGTLGGFLTSVHQIPTTQIEGLVPHDTVPLPAWLAETEETYRTLASRLPASAGPLIEDFLGGTPPPEPDATCFCHNDLGAEHVLVDPACQRITGVIDWSDAAIADPAHDLGLIFRDLGPAVLDLVVADYRGSWGDADRARAVFYARCALLEDIAYGLNTPGADHYAQAGLEHLAWTFR